MRKQIIILILAMLSILCYKYWDSIFLPSIHKVSGKETVGTILNKIEENVWTRLEKKLDLAGYKMGYPQEIVLAAFKEEQVLQVYAKGYNGIKWIKNYPFTGFSGVLGPKLKEGDKQIPEGIYQVEYLNPNSAYYLSIKVSYPNEYDKSKTAFAQHADMGGDIFIHGKSATIGCVPIGDEAIEEVFVLTHKAMNYPVKIIISPRDFRVNPAYPQIEAVTWTNELYELIHKELNLLPVSTDK